MQDNKLQELLDSLSVTEKIGQLVQVPGEVLNTQGQELGVREDLGLSEEIVRNVGSTLNVVGAERMKAVQKAYLERSRHKIPLLFMADIIYGFRTVFPIPLALGCSFDPGLLEKLCEVTSEESVAAGAHVTFSPMVDLVRDARWGRCLESTGEDPYMNSLYAAAMVKGFQKGLGSDKPAGMASCVKHFAAYGAPEGGRDYNTVDMSQRRLRQEYLPSYKAGVEAGCEMIMTSFNTVDGIPSTGNKWLMNDVLRDEWGFDGVVITDYAAIAELVLHGAAEDQKDAARLAMEAGVDIDMCTGCYANYLEELIQEGKIDEKQLDKAVMRILKLKNKLGLFEDPYRGADEAEETRLFLSEGNRSLAREAAVKTMVLLENKESALPLEAGGKIALIGPYADNQDALGMWAIHGRKEAVITLKTALEEAAGKENVVSASGCETLLEKDYCDLPALRKQMGMEGWSPEKRQLELEKAAELAEKADVAVLALGEAVIQGGEGGSRTSLEIPGDQLELLRRVREKASKVIVVLFGGRPLVLDEVSRLSDALLEVWFPGTEGGRGIADVLFGKANPSGRLSMSMPRSVGQMPLYYNHFNTGRPYDGVTPNRFFSRYTDCSNTPLYPFGYGLSYHKAEYGPLTLSSHTLHRESSLAVKADITNTGDAAGTEAVQLYIRDVAGSVVRPVKELKGVQLVSLEAGETKTVEFSITEEMLCFYGKDMEYRAETGRFQVMIAPHSGCEMQAEFVLE
nr:beta-glucosidase BglX [uncultured Eisenbergiella sp.]